jgi:hypothetical protein
MGWWRQYVAAQIIDPKLKMMGQKLKNMLRKPKNTLSMQILGVPLH